MRVLVTGGGGFLGRALAEMLLNRGDRVRIFSRQKYPELERLGIESHAGDIRDMDAVSRACMGIEAVFHTAARPGIWGPEDEYRAIHVEGSRNVIEACKRRGTPKVIYTSSPSVVFNMADEEGIDESTPYPKRYFNPYSQTKAEAEQLVLQASGRDGLLTCALRPHLIYGPRDNHLLPRLIGRAKRGKLRIVGEGRNRVDLTYVDNAAFAHVLACDALSPQRVAGRAFFISDGAPVVLWDWINALLAELGQPPVKKRIGAGAAFTLGRLCESLYRLTGRTSEPPMTRFLAKALSCSHFYSIEAAKREFRYRLQVQPDEALRRTVEWLKGAEKKGH